MVTHLMPVSALAQTGMYSLVHISGRGLAQEIYGSAMSVCTGFFAQPAKAAHGSSSMARRRHPEVPGNMALSRWMKG